MDTDKFKKAYSESRNGASYFVRHPLVRQFQYSDGVQECAEAGCYWLLDIFATELPAAMRKADTPVTYIEVKVEGSKAALRAVPYEGAEPIWSRDVDWTDMPPGYWNFELVDEGERFALILLTEH
jgi:hypothetical protein